MLGNLFAQPLSPHIPYISSPNRCLLFAPHAHTIATCFAVVSILYHLFCSCYITVETLQWSLLLVHWAVNVKWLMSSLCIYCVFCHRELNEQSVMRLAVCHVAYLAAYLTVCRGVSRLSWPGTWHRLCVWVLCRLGQHVHTVESHTQRSVSTGQWTGGVHQTDCSWHRPTATCQQRRTSLSLCLSVCLHDCLPCSWKPVPDMSYNVFSRSLNPTHSLTHSFIRVHASVTASASVKFLSEDDKIVRVFRLPVLRNSGCHVFCRCLLLISSLPAWSLETSQQWSAKLLSIFLTCTTL